MKKTIALLILILSAVIGSIVAVKADQFITLSNLPNDVPSQTISTFDVAQKPWQQSFLAIGTLEAFKGLVVTADLSGRVTAIHFEAGSEVKTGDLLVEQDTSAERAQLRSAEAEAALTGSNLNRIRALYRQKVASKAELDNAQSAYSAARASVDNILAAIEKKSIRAPFDGRLGIRQINLGQTIDAGQAVVSLQATNQMFVNFSLPQKSLSQLKVGLVVRLSIDVEPDKVFEGQISTIAPEVDPDTRSVRVQAILDNTDNLLVPGMFASIQVILPDVEPFLTIPIVAVQYATFGDSVFVIEKSENNDSLIARQQFVKLGEKRGDFVQVLKGLSEGQTIASAGVFKLRNKIPVSINNEVLPDFQFQPIIKDQ